VDCEKAALLQVLMGKRKAAAQTSYRTAKIWFLSALSDTNCRYKIIFRQSPISSSHLDWLGLIIRVAEGWRLAGWVFLFRRKGQGCISASAIVLPTDSITDQP
jgi:hypothetical protein